MGIKTSSWIQVSTVMFPFPHHFPPPITAMSSLEPELFLTLFSEVDTKEPRYLLRSPGSIMKQIITEYFDGTLKGLNFLIRSRLEGKTSEFQFIYILE